jgi:hypothetical protein
MRRWWAGQRVPVLSMRHRLHRLWSAPHESRQSVRVHLSSAIPSTPFPSRAFDPSTVYTASVPTAFSTAVTTASIAATRCAADTATEALAATTEHATTLTRAARRRATPATISPSPTSLIPTASTAVAAAVATAIATALTAAAIATSIDPAIAASASALAAAALFAAFNPVSSGKPACRALCWGPRAADPRGVAGG